MPPASTLRSLGAGYDNLMADGLYLQFVNYFGKHLARDKQYHNVMPVLEAITELDPNFRAPYHLGGLALGDSGRIEELVAFMKKSVRAFPDDWQVAFDAGMAVFVFAETPEQYLEAAALFKRAAELPGAEPKARYMEARSYHVSDRQDLVIRIWQDLYRHSPSAEARKVAQRSLERLGVPPESSPPAQ